MKQGDLKRAQQAMRTERLRLKEDRLLLEREQRRMELERDELRAEIADLRIQLAHANEEISRMAAKVARSREEAARAVARQRAAEHPLATRPATRAAASVPTPVPTPGPLRPTALPPIEHRTIPVRAEQGRELGWRSTCTCGWRSAFERTEQAAIQAGAIHVDRMVPATTRRGAR